MASSLLAWPAAAFITREPPLIMEHEKSKRKRVDETTEQGCTTGNHQHDVEEDPALEPLHHPNKKLKIRGLVPSSTALVQRTTLSDTTTQTTPIQHDALPIGRPLLAAPIFPATIAVARSTTRRPAKHKGEDDEIVAVPPLHQWLARHPPILSTAARAVAAMDTPPPANNGEEDDEVSG